MLRRAAPDGKPSAAADSKGHGEVTAARPFGTGAWIAGLCAGDGTGWRGGATGASGDFWAGDFTSAGIEAACVWAVSAAWVSLRFLTFSSFVTH
jgi:hypothetical protein